MPLHVQLRNLLHQGLTGIAKEKLWLNYRFRWPTTKNVILMSTKGHVLFFAGVLSLLSLSMFSILSLLQVYCRIRNRY